METQAIHITRTGTDDPRLAMVENGLDAYNLEFAPQALEVEPFAYIATDNQGNFAGGARGKIFAGWMNISLLLAASPKQGLGSKLMHAMEALAHQKQCRGIRVDTFAFQAPKFYEKHGYQRYAEIPDYVNGHSRIFYLKRLESTSQ